MRGVSTAQGSEPAGLEACVLMLRGLCVGPATSLLSIDWNSSHTGRYNITAEPVNNSTTPTCRSFQWGFENKTRTLGSAGTRRIGVALSWLHDGKRAGFAKLAILPVRLKSFRFQLTRKISPIWPDRKLANFCHTVIRKIGPRRGGDLYITHP